MSNLWVDTAELGEFAESEYAYDAVKTASYLLWGLSGRKFSGTTTVTERYVSTLEPLLSSSSSVAATPVLINGRVENIAGSRGSNARQDLMGDGSSSSRRVRLRGRKVVEVHNLRDIYGEIIDPSTYYMGDHSTIYGTPNAKWTSASIEVTYTYGSPPRPRDALLLEFWPPNLSSSLRATTLALSPNVSLPLPGRACPTPSSITRTSLTN